MEMLQRHSSGKPCNFSSYLIFTAPSFFYSLLFSTSLQIFIAAAGTISLRRMFMISLYLVRSFEETIQSTELPIILP